MTGKSLKLKGIVRLMNISRRGRGIWLRLVRNIIWIRRLSIRNGWIFCRITI